MFTVTRSIRLGAVLVMFGCGGDGVADGVSGEFSSENCTTEWDCINGVCACADGSACDDEEDCDAACEVCD